MTKRDKGNWYEWVVCWLPVWAVASLKSNLSLEKWHPIHNPPSANMYHELCKERTTENCSMLLYLFVHYFRQRLYFYSSPIEITTSVRGKTRWKRMSTKKNKIWTIYPKEMISFACRSLLISTWLCFITCAFAVSIIITFFDYPKKRGTTIPYKHRGVAATHNATTK